MFWLGFGGRWNRSKVRSSGVSLRKSTHLKCMCSLTGENVRPNLNSSRRQCQPFNPISIPQETMSGLVDPEETVPVALSPYDKEKITIVRTSHSSPRRQTLNQPAS